jgi:alpha 1,2-mannosyltransferase
MLIPVLQRGLTPESARHDPTFHPRPAFLHAILAKHRENLQHSKLFSHIRRPRLDGITEPQLVRTLYEYTGDCFAITLKGPDGASDTSSGVLDGQGVVMDDMRNLLGDDRVWKALENLSQDFVAINRHR